MTNSLFPPEVIKWSQEAQKETGCLASVTLAQWAEESAYGKSMPLKSCNPFGMKWTKNSKYPFIETYTKEEIHGHMLTITSKFIKFPDFPTAFVEHGKLLMNPNGPYYRALPYKTNAEQFVKTIGPIYATDSRYTTNVLSIIKTNNLTQYDKVS